MEQTKAQMEADGSPGSGTMVICSDCELIETATGSSIDLTDTPQYIDNRVGDLGAFTFSSLAIGREATIDIDQTTEPTFSATGVTFTKVSPQDFESDTRMQVLFKVQSNTEILYYYLKTY